MPRFTLPPLDADGMIWYLLASTILVAITMLALLVVMMHRHFSRLAMFASTMTALMYFLEPLRQHPLYVVMVFFSFMLAFIFALHQNGQIIGKFFVGAAMPIGVLDACVSLASHRLSFYLSFVQYNAPYSNWQIAAIIGFTFVCSVSSGILTFHLPSSYYTISCICTGSFLASLTVSVLVALFVHPIHWFPWARLFGGLVVTISAIYQHVKEPLVNIEECTATMNTMDDLAAEKYNALRV